MTIAFPTAWILRVAAALCLLLGVSATASADVAKVNGHLQRAEVNLKSVADSVAKRTSPPTGAAGKILASRLQQALDDITPAKEWLDKVPAGAAGREEAAARYEAAAAEYDRLREFLTGSSAPPPQQSGGTKLDYQQEEVLKGARFNLREVEGGADHLTSEVGTLREVKDQLSIDFREVEGLLGVVENAMRKSGFVKDALDKLPEDGAGVAEVRQQLVNADAKIVAANDFLKPLGARLRTLIDPAQYPEFTVDRNRLRELSIMFANSAILQINRSLAADTLKQTEAARAECTRIQEKYARLVQQRTEQGKEIEGAGGALMGNIDGFLAAAAAEKAALPEAIRENLKTAKTYAAEAVAEQKPLWFTGGIPQSLGYAEERVDLLSVMDEAAGARMRSELEQVKKEIKAQEDSLRELIIKENRMPRDEFKGADRAEAIKVAESAWKVQQKEFKVLAVRIPAEQWARETKWTYSNGTWYFSDRSKLQVRLIVADHENPDLAIDRPVNVWKDHQKGDSMIGTPVFGFEDKLQPSNYLLRSNVKKS